MTKTKITPTNRTPTSRVVEVKTTDAPEEVRFVPKHIKIRSRKPRIQEVPVDTPIIEDKPPPIFSDHEKKLIVAQFCREIRINFFGITQLQFAELLGLNLQTYLSYEYAKIKTPQNIINKIKSLLDNGLSIEYKNVNSYDDKSIDEIIEVWKKRVGFYDENMFIYQFTAILGVSSATFWRWSELRIKPKKHSLLRYEKRIISYEEAKIKNRQNK